MRPRHQYRNRSFHRMPCLLSLRGRHLPEKKGPLRAVSCLAGAFTARVCQRSPARIWNAVAESRRTMAERVGFEPTVPQKEHNGFRGRRLQPLGHLSAESSHFSKTLLSETRIVADSRRVNPIHHRRSAVKARPHVCCRWAGCSRPRLHHYLIGCKKGLAFAKSHRMRFKALYVQGRASPISV